MDRATSTAEQLQALVRKVLGARLPEYDPWFYRYCGELVGTESLATYIRYKSDLLAFAAIEPRGARILDAGAGFGLTLLVLATMGAKQAQGIEISGPMARTVKAYLPMLPRHLKDRIAIDKGDVMALPYADNSFDAVLSVEAISHYGDVESAAREIHRVLRSGGVLAISDGNNGLNPVTRRKTLEVWDAFELGSNGRRVHGHLVEHNYQAERAQFIAEHFPSVPAERMAGETFGMTFPEIEEACLAYEREGSFPGSVYGRSKVPVNPSDGQVIERLFNPYRLSRMLERVGFDVHVQGYWGGASGRKSLRLANALLAPLSRATIYTARGFRIAAMKPRR